MWSRAFRRAAPCVQQLGCRALPKQFGAAGAVLATGATAMYAFEKSRQPTACEPEPGLFGSGKAGFNEMIFQLGTNNWQRPKKDGSGLEFAPGSGVLHEDHHNAFNDLDGVKSYSMYPSSTQAQAPADADYRVFQLDHDIPICESASPNSSKRWHGFSEAEFEAYVKRLENEVYDYMKACEKREGKKFTMVIAHHSFVNPLVMQRVIQRRVKEGLPKIPLYAFVHGTALKMYKWELGGTNPKEYPMRFHKMIKESNLFNDTTNGVKNCFVISEDQKKILLEVFPTFPADRIIVAPNGINTKKFHAREKGLTQVVTEQTREIVWPKSPSEADCKKNYWFGGIRG